MTIDALPTAPAPGDSKSVFNSRMFAFLAALVGFVPQANELAADANDDAAAADAARVLAETAKTASEAARDAANASAAASAASAGGAVWASGSYTTGARAWSPTNQRLYRRLSPGGASPTDPASDPTNWASVPIDLPVEIVTGTSGTLRANVRTVATNAAACAFTAPTLAAGDSFEVDFQNGRLNNSVDIAAQTIKGPNGSTASGVITHNVRGLLRLYSDGTNLRSAS
jgi:hypothetical protein